MLALKKKKVLENQISASIFSLCKRIPLCIIKFTIQCPSQYVILKMGTDKYISSLGYPENYPTNVNY